MMGSTGKKLQLYAAGSLFAIASIALGGCAMSNYGKLKSNPEATHAFEVYQNKPDHKYYYRGTFSAPSVVVGISQNYELSSKLWVEIDPQTEDFRTLVERVSLQGSGGTTSPWGFDIIDTSGNYVGVWYSASRAAVVEIDENGRITLLSPMVTVTKGDQPG